MVISQNQVEFESTYCCDNPHIVEDGGYFVCCNCGTVESSVYDNSPPPIYTAEDKKNRIKTHRVFNPIGPRSIMHGNMDDKGKIINPQLWNLYRRLDRLNRCLGNHVERNIYNIKPVLETIQTKMNLPDSFADDTLHLYIHCLENNLAKGRRNETLLIVCLYLILRFEKITVTREELCELVQIPIKKFQKTFKLLYQEILPYLKRKPKRFTSEDYVDKFYKQLKLPIKCRHLALKILKNAKNRGYNDAGKDPKGVAGGVLYIAAHLIDCHLYQKDISLVVKITTITLRLRILEINKYTGIEDLLSKNK